MVRLEPKAPSEIRNYSFDWTTFLGEDTIASSSVQVSGVTLDSSVPADDSVTVKVSGGTGGTVATITNTITTAGGLVETETFMLPITDAEEPVSLEETKAQLRIVDDDSEDALIASYIRSARAYVESESGYVFVRRQFVDTFNYWPCHLTVGRRPLISIDSVVYTDTAGASQTVSSAAYYVAALRGRVTPLGAWPALGIGGAISVTYTAGFTEDDQAEEIDLARQAILMLVSHWFDNRSTVSVGSVQVSEIPFAVKALVDRFRTPVI